jgi:uncharacterized protein
MTETSEYERLPPMSQYVLALFRRVPNRPEIPEAEADRIQEAHMANLRRLTELGELLTAGPFLEDTDLRGVGVFAAGPVERIRALTASDPAIVSGQLSLDLFTWYAPAGLRVVAAASKRAPTTT